jgi:hypothetical protein
MDTRCIPYPGMSENMRTAENRASQGGKPANEGAYFPYVTEICGCGQRRKQDHTVILRLRGFFGGLGYAVHPVSDVKVTMKTTGGRLLFLSSRF